MSAIVRPVGNGMGNAAMDAMSVTVPADLAPSRPVSRQATEASGNPPPPRRIHGLRRERQDAERFRQSLIRHVGGEPTVTQRALIDTLAALKLKLNVFDARFIEEGGMSPHARREYLAFVNSFGRLLARLGLKAAPPPVPTLAELLATPHDQGAEAAE